MQPIVAVPSFICADAFSKFLPFCTGFAAGCMIWMVIAEVLPDAFKVISQLCQRYYDIFFSCSILKTNCFAFNGYLFQFFGFFYYGNSQNLSY